MARMNILKRAPPKETPQFVEDHSLASRKAEALRVRKEYPDRIPCVVEISRTSQNLPSLDKHKYLVPGDITLGTFIHVLRKRMKLAPEQALFPIIERTLPPQSRTMESLYQEHKRECQFLYLILTAENTFGC